LPRWGENGFYDFPFRMALPYVMLLRPVGAIQNDVSPLAGQNTDKKVICERLRKKQRVRVQHDKKFQKFLKNSAQNHKIRSNS
jgi:hypothetical protein